MQGPAVGWTSIANARGPKIGVTGGDSRKNRSRVCPGSDATHWQTLTRAAPAHVSSLWLHEQADKAGRALGMTFKLRIEVRQRQAGRQFLRLKIGCDDLEGVVVRRAGRRARAGIRSDALRTLAADIFVALLAHFALCEGGRGRRDAVGDPVIDVEPGAAFRID